MRRSRRKKVQTVEVFWDSQRRICLMVDKSDGVVKFIPMDITDGFQVSETSEQSFYQRYSEMSGFPVDRAAQLYVNYATAVGASEDVVIYLENMVNITDEDREKMLSRLLNLPKKVVREVEKAVVRSKRKPRRADSKPTHTTEYKSASQMFQDLIMVGELTDAEIFDQVKEAFGLDEKKRGYVSWYRNNLKKKGENPPEAK